MKYSNAETKAYVDKLMTLRAWPYVERIVGTVLANPTGRWTAKELQRIAQCDRRVQRYLIIGIVKKYFIIHGVNFYPPERGKGYVLGNTDLDRLRDMNRDLAVIAAYIRSHARKYENMTVSNPEQQTDPNVREAHFRHEVAYKIGQLFLSTLASHDTHLNQQPETRRSKKRAEEAARAPLDEFGLGRKDPDMTAHRAPRSPKKDLK